MTAQTLAPIIAKRVRYKALRQAAAAAGDGEASARWDRRQDAIKWLLVCCFGYLGYRNARFGRIEAHEATCAFSREKLLQCARRSAEDARLSRCCTRSSIACGSAAGGDARGDRRAAARKSTRRPS